MQQKIGEIHTLTVHIPKISDPFRAKISYFLGKNSWFFLDLLKFPPLQCSYQKSTLTVYLCLLEKHTLSRRTYPSAILPGCPPGYTKQKSKSSSTGQPTNNKEQRVVNYTSSNKKQQPNRTLCLNRIGSGFHLRFDKSF